MQKHTGKLSFPKVGVSILLANVFGIAIYLWGAQHAWVIPEEMANGIHVTTGEPFVWVGYVFPIWILFLTINVTWGWVIVARRRWLDGGMWLVAFCFWILAIIVDFAHH